MAIDTAQKRAAMVEIGDQGAAVYVPSLIDTKLERALIAFAFDPQAGAGGGGGGGTDAAVRDRRFVTWYRTLARG